ncbi:MAG: helix-turn-helix domain-containing protein, partial [Neobacillus sp.]
HATALFWERLSLLVQVTSNLVFHETQYIPIQKNKEVHFWLKSTLKNFQVPRNEIGNLLFSELMECFEEDKNIDPSFLVFRLTGYQKIGLTPLQMAQKFKIDFIDYHIEFINVLHFLIGKVEINQGQFRLLPELLKGLTPDDSLTQSSRKTWILMNQGYTIEQIAGKRRLKKSTIEDHIVEFALNVDDFSIDEYVDNDMQKEILEISRQEETKQLKRIRNYLEVATYFQIRLVLAKYGDRQWN